MTSGARDRAGGTAIYLVRAGRTDLSDGGRLQGRAQLPLLAQGVDDARRATDRLRRLEIAAVYTSPLARAWETADIIARSVHVRARPVPGLLDVDVGRWIGRTPDEIAASEPDAFDVYFRFPVAASFPSGERMVDAQRRVFEALGSVAGRHRERAIVAVTHEIPIRLVLVRLRRLEGTAMWDPSVPPGSIIELRSTEEGLELPTVLEDLFRAAARTRSHRSSL